MSGIRIGFPLEKNKEIIPENTDNAEYLYIVEIWEGSPRNEEWHSWDDISSCNMDVFIVFNIPDGIKKALKDRGILILQTEVRNYKDALLGYATGMRRFKPL